MSDWFVTVNGKEKGPYAAAQIRKFVKQEKIFADTMIRKQGMSEPMRADEIKGLLPAGTAERPKTQRRSKQGDKADGGKRSAKSNQPQSTRRVKKGAQPESIDYGESENAGAAPAPGTFDPFEKDDDYIKHVEAQQIGDQYPLEAMKAFLYPLSMNAIALILGFVVLSLIFVYAGIFLINAWSGFHYIFFFLVGWFICYGIAYLQRIGQRTAAGDLKAPVWPELGAMLEEILGPAAVMIGTWVLLKIPYILIAWGNADYLPVSHDLSGMLSGIDTYLFHAFDLMLRLPNEGIEYAMQLISALLLPIGVLYVMVKGSFLGLNPGPLFKTVFSIMPEYLMCVALCLVSQVAMMLILGEVGAAYGMQETFSLAYMCFDFLPTLGFVDVLIFSTLSLFTLGYFLILQFRLMGLLYCCKSDSFD